MTSAGESVNEIKYLLFPSPSSKIEFALFMITRFMTESVFRFRAMCVRMFILPFKSFSSRLKKISHFYVPICSETGNRTLRMQHFRSLLEHS